MIEYLCFNFWDDTVEWTLREALPTPEAIQNYLAEVNQVPDRLFHILTDQDLQKKIFLPNHTLTTIGQELFQTLLHAVHHRG